ncbi:hypothetical protein BKA69DRAFT_78336 [Paraphysoderma sedebokerense]|nr:hypothetical protein BKA69DRAFT_78336 [Paraphysoderma sedebokerense]
MIVVVAVGGIVLLYLLIRLTANGPGLGIASISINFVQMIVIVRELQLNWTTEFQAVMNSLSFVNLNIELVSPECLIQDESINYTFKMKVTLLLPVIFIGILAIIAIMNSSLMRKARSAIGATSSFYLRYQYKRPDKLTEWRAQTELYYLLLRGFHALLIFLYVTVTSKTLSFFDCTLEGDSFYYLDADRSLRCYEPWWYDNLPFALAGLLFYVVGIPVYFLAVFFFLYQERRDGAFWMKWKDIVKEAVSRNSFFKDEYQYFIFIQLMQKLFMISVKQFFTRYTTLQILLTIFLCLFAYATYWRYKPYNHMTLNYLEILSVVSSGLILGFGLLLYNQEFPSEKNRFVISILLLLLIFGFFCAVAVAVILEFHSRLKDIPLVNRFFFPPLSPASSVPELNSKPLARAKSVKVLEPARSTNGLNRESKRSYSHLPAPQGNLLDPSHMFIRSTSNLSGDNI